MNKRNLKNKMNKEDKRERNNNINMQIFAITLTARKNIMKIQKFKKLIMFKVIFKKSKKILKSNDF